jgi:hypothetical protein
MNIKIITFVFSVSFGLSAFARPVPAATCSAVEINKDGSFNSKLMSDLFYNSSFPEFRKGPLYRSATGVSEWNEKSLVDYLKVPRIGYSKLRAITYDNAYGYVSYKYNGTIAAQIYDALLTHSLLEQRQNKLVRFFEEQPGDFEKIPYTSNLVSLSKPISAGELNGHGHSIKDEIAVTLKASNGSKLTCYHQFPETHTEKIFLREDGSTAFLLVDSGEVVNGPWQLWSAPPVLRSNRSREGFSCVVQGDFKAIGKTLYTVLSELQFKAVRGHDVIDYPQSKIRSEDQERFVPNVGYEVDIEALDKKAGGHFEGIALTESKCGFAMLCNQDGCTMERYTGATIVSKDYPNLDEARNR